MKTEYMKKLLTLLIGVTALWLQAVTPVKYELNVGEFHELKVVDGINVTYSCNPDSAGQAVFICNPEDASIFIFSNPKDKGVLSIQLSSKGVECQSLPEVRVYSSYLTKVENSGDSLVKVTKVSEGPKFSAQLIGNGRIVVNNIKSTEVNAGLTTGNGTLVLSGTCDIARIKLVGTGVIQADALKAKNVSVKAGGTGSVGIWATEHLSVSGVGSTKIYYKGDPEIKKSALGTKIFKM